MAVIKPLTAPDSPSDPWPSFRAFAFGIFSDQACQNLSNHCQRFFNSIQPFLEFFVHFLTFLLTARQLGAWDLASRPGGEGYSRLPLRGTGGVVEEGGKEQGQV